MGIKSTLKQLINLLKTKQQLESKYYTALFTKNTYWNTQEPNGEEQMRWTIIKGFIDSIADNTDLNILDLGCGRGWLSNLLTRYGNVTSIEPVRNVVNYGNKLFPGLNIKCGTSKDLLKNGYVGIFDMVVSSEVIEHIPDNQKADFLNDIHRLLKPDGYAIITTPRKDVEAEWNKYTGANQPVEDWLTENQLKKYFIDCSFYPMEIKRFGIPPIESAPLIEIYQLWLVQKLTQTISI